MEPRHKTAPVEFKTEGKPGFFSALVSVFNNVDSVGDRVMPGAFKKTLGKWRQGGDPIPIVFNHDWGSPDAHIGVADPRAVMETDKGLLVQGQLDIEDNPVAKQVYKLLKRRSLKSFSFGYVVPEGGEKVAEDGANELLEIDLVEAGPTLRGANSEAQLQEVKSALDVEAPASVGVDGTVTVDHSTVPVSTETSDTTNLDAEEPPAEVPGEEKSEESHEDDAAVERPEVPLTGEALEKAIEESDRFQEIVAARVEERLKAEREQHAAEEPEPSLTQEEVENVESEKPAEPVKPAAKDALKNEIDLLRLEIAVGKPLRR